MTVAVVAMNANGAVLAADKAITVTGANGAERIYDGGKKIYPWRAGDDETGGVLCYGSTSVATVSVGTLLAEHLRQRTRRPSSIKDSVNELRCWLASQELTPNHENMAWIASLSAYVQRLVSTARLNCPGESEFKIALTAEVQKESLRLAGLPYLHDRTDGDFTELVHRDYDCLLQAVRNGLGAEFDAVSRTVRSQLIYLLAKAAVKQTDVNDPTGLVFVGYDDRDTKPTGVHMKLYGADPRGPLVGILTELTLTPQRPYVLEPYAETDDVNGFLTGRHPLLVDRMRDLWRCILSDLGGIAGPLVAGLVERLGRDLDKDWQLSDDQVGELIWRLRSELERIVDERFASEWLDLEVDGVATAMHRNIGNLPIPELVKTAEGLLGLPGLRRRLTLDVQGSSSDEADIATVTHDGFAWAGQGRSG
jgi:hypothetical protein